MSIKIYPEEPCLLPVTYPSNPLEVYSKTYSDIEDILMCFKTKASDNESDVLVKYYKDGTGNGSVSGEVLVDESTHTFTMVKTENDIVPINPKGFKMFIGVKVSGLSKMLWLRVNQQDCVVIEEDGISI